jgi:hypothetical protein
MIGTGLLSIEEYDVHTIAMPAGSFSGVRTRDLGISATHRINVVAGFDTDPGTGTVEVRFGDSTTHADNPVVLTFEVTGREFYRGSIETGHAGRHLSLHANGTVNGTLVVLANEA